MSRLSLLVLTLSLGLTLPSFGEQLLESGGFEWPPVSNRKARSEGGDLIKSAMNANWVTFRDVADGKEGKLVLGLTNEISLRGRQAMFVHFDKVKARSAVATLSSDLISVLPEKTYRIGIWGRLDKTDPIALDTRRPYLRLRVDWFKPGVDEDTGEEAMEQTGEPEFRSQVIPGALNREPFFSSKRWTQFATEMEAPADAKFVKITWTWETTPQDGETNGLIYFDDATIEGPAGPKVDPFADDPVVQAEMAEDAKNPNLVQPDEGVSPLNTTPLNTPAPSPRPPSPTAPPTPQGQ
jgi:hypothetical protein